MSITTPEIEVFEDSKQFSFFTIVNLSGIYSKLQAQLPFKGVEIGIYPTPLATTERQLLQPREPRQRTGSETSATQWLLYPLSPTLAMKQPFSNLDLTDLLDWQSLNETQTELSTEHFHKAASLSQSIYLPQQRWEVYVNALAVLGFERWLQERAPDLNIRTEESYIWQPSYGNLLSSACNIQVDKFKLCIVTSSNLIDEHSIPFAVFDVPGFTAHLYVLMQVMEEQQQVAVSGFISYEDYCRYQQTAQLQVEQDWTYTIPENWFNADANALLLNLRCLSADAIQLPVNVNANIQTDSVAVLKQKLIKVDSQLKNKYPWQLLTVKEGFDLFNSSELIDLTYKLAAPSPLQPLINVGYWLNNQVDAMTTELGWVLMPSLKVSEIRSLDNENSQRLSAIRSFENFGRIRSGLEQQGVHIPAMARGAYRDLECGDKQSLMPSALRTSLRLYAITWRLSENSENPEWVLLVALGSQPQVSMPETLKLEVRDETQLLFEQELKDTSKGILYARVIGNYGEHFYVNVTVDEEVVIEIPPFGFENG